MLADLVHHVRTELNTLQLARVIYIYCCNLHNQSITTSIQTMCAKLLMNLVECVLQKDTPEGAAKVLQGLLVSCIDKLGALNAMQKDLTASAERLRAGGQEKSDIILIEKSKPTSSAAYVNELPEDVIRGASLLFPYRRGLYQYFFVSHARFEILVSNAATWVSYCPQQFENSGATDAGRRTLRAHV
jgi:transformation/transcription domain-associated protein